MKHSLKITVCCAILLIVGICASNSFAQKQQERKEQIVGGYSEASNTDAEIIAAAKYAVKAQAKKEHAKIKYVAVTQAEKQIVAGLNYRLCVSIEVKEKGKKAYAPKTIQTVVYQNLKQKLSLTEWAENGCSKANTEMIN